jgi:hypothetical protein
VLLPGLVLARLLLPATRGPLEHLALGGALGYAAEIAAYAGAAEAGLRGVFVLYPVPWLVVALWAWWRSRGERARPLWSSEAVSPAFAWVVAGACVVLTLYHAVTYFADTPLPWQVAEARYLLPDPMYQLGLVSEARHHWPVMDPNAAGVDFPYHIWAHVQMASVGQVTGLDLSLVLFRLFVVPLSLLFAVQLVVAGRRLTGRVWVGAIAAVLVLFVGELDFFYRTEYLYPFAWLIPNLGFTLSPTFLLGQAFFLPVLVLIWERLESGEGFRAAWRQWTAIGVLLLGCAGAKATILPVLAGALGLQLALGLLRRRVDRNLVGAFALTTFVLLTSFAVVYRGSGTWGSEVEPPGTIRQMAALLIVKDKVDGVLSGAGFWIPAAVVGTVAALGAALVGIPWLLRYRGWRLGPVRTLLVCCFVAGLGPFLLVTQIGGGQTFFTAHGVTAAGLLSAEGLYLLVTRVARSVPAVIVRASAVVCAWIVALVFLAGATAWWLPSLGDAAMYVVAALVVAVVSGFLRIGLGSPLPAAALASLLAGLFVWWKAGSLGNVAAAYLFLVLGLLVLAGFAVAECSARREWLLFAATVAVVSASALNLPLDHTRGETRRLRETVDAQLSTDVTRDLFRGLVWLRESTDEDAVVAVNNYYEHYGPARVPTFASYAAFGERRVFLGGWALSAPKADAGLEDVFFRGRITFPERYRLNEAVFRRADRLALQIMVRDYGVRYLLVDRIHGTAAARIRELGRVVFANPAVVIYRVA